MDRGFRRSFYLLEELTEELRQSEKAAYEKLMPAVFAAKLTPVGESREVYLYFEGVDSPNNVVQLQIGVK